MQLEWGRSIENTIDITNKYISLLNTFDNTICYVFYKNRLYLGGESIIFTRN